MKHPIKRSLVRAKGSELRFAEDNKLIRKPALLIQPSLGLLLFVGESDEAWKMKQMYDSVQGFGDIQNDPLAVVSLCLNLPYGFSAKQAEYAINRMVLDIGNFVVQFYEHLCLDNDVRVWLEDEMRKSKAA